MPRPKSEYADFHLVDPTRISSEGLKGATVMTIGALIHGIPSMSPGSPAQMGMVVNHNIADLGHTEADKKRLLERATETGAWQLYFCSRCGNRLGVRRCVGCKQAYDAGRELPGTTHLMLPRKVAAYAQQHGHRFSGRR